MARRFCSALWLITSIVLSLGQLAAQEIRASVPSGHEVNSEQRDLGTASPGNLRYVTDVWNWHQSVLVDLSTPGPGKSITLSPCPLGISTSGNANKPFYVYISTEKDETALVTGGTCTPGAKSGTIIVTTIVPHSNGNNAVQSAYSGIQEALNDCGTPGCEVVIPPTGTNATALAVYATIYMQNNKSYLRGEGKATLLCKTRSVCLFLGDRVDSNDWGGMQVSGIRFAAGNDFDGIQITKIACSSDIATLTLSNTGPNAFVGGDWVDVNWTFIQPFIGIHQIKGSSSTEITFDLKRCGGYGNIPSKASAGFASLENAALEDNSSDASVSDLYTDDFTSWHAWGVWQNQIVIDNDQAFKLDTLNTAGVHCTSNYCGQVIYAPGPFSSNAAVLWLSHLNLSLQCRGNGITAWNGNTLRVEDSVIQGFAQWGVYTGIKRGGYGPSQFDNVYEEVGGCTNPLYPGSGEQKHAEAGLINNTAPISIHGGEFPVGNLPRFAALGDQSARYNYCFIVHDTVHGTSKCLPIGYALVDSTHPSGSILLSWPRVPGTGTVTYDILRYPGRGGDQIYPYKGGCNGGSPKVCGSVVLRQPQCSSILCSFADRAETETSNFLVPDITYLPGIPFLAGGAVNIVTADSPINGTASITSDDGPVVTNVSPAISENWLSPQFFTHRCSGLNGGEWISCLAGNSFGNSAMPNSTVLQYGIVSGGPRPNLKGRLNITSSPQSSIASGEIITLVDSDPAKTFATPGNRPTQDSKDSYIGMDQGSASYGSAQIAYGAPVAQSFYIGSTPDGSSYKERLTSRLKTFNVPVQIKPGIFATLRACSSETEGELMPVTDSATNTWGTKIEGDGKNHVLAYCDGTQWTVAAR